MADLISRTGAIARIDKCVTLSGIGCEPVMAVRDIKALISVLPAVDAVPVVHGRWIRYSEIFHDPEYTLVKCSVCGGESCCDANYCPDCGAKMDGERRDEDGKDA